MPTAALATATIPVTQCPVEFNDSPFKQYITVIINDPPHTTHTQPFPVYSRKLPLEPYRCPLNKPE